MIKLQSSLKILEFSVRTRTIMRSETGILAVVYPGGLQTWEGSTPHLCSSPEARNWQRGWRRVGVGGGVEVLTREIQLEFLVWGSY